MKPCRICGAGWCALLIAVVRVLTGVHHIRDVAAGLALGFACGFGSITDFPVKSV